MALVVTSAASVCDTDACLPWLLAAGIDARCEVWHRIGTISSRIGVRVAQYLILKAVRSSVLRVIGAGAYWTTRRGRRY